MFQSPLEKNAFIIRQEILKMGVCIPKGFIDRFLNEHYVSLDAFLRSNTLPVSTASSSTSVDESTYEDESILYYEITCHGEEDIDNGSTGTEDNANTPIIMLLWWNYLWNCCLFELDEIIDDWIVGITLFK